jgi:hypothetical protein
MPREACREPAPSELVPAAPVQGLPPGDRPGHQDHALAGFAGVFVAAELEVLLGLVDVAPVAREPIRGQGGRYSGATKTRHPHPYLLLWPAGACPASGRPPWRRGTSVRRSRGVDHEDAKRYPHKYPPTCGRPRRARAGRAGPRSGSTPRSGTPAASPTTVWRRPERCASRRTWPRSRRGSAGSSSSVEGPVPARPSRRTRPLPRPWPSGSRPPPPRPTGGRMATATRRRPRPPRPRPRGAGSRPRRWRCCGWSPPARPTIGGQSCHWSSLTTARRPAALLPGCHAATVGYIRSHRGRSTSRAFDLAGAAVRSRRAPLSHVW